jgi:uncharacterized membrane protein SpoIIM required for sporulation
VLIVLLTTIQALVMVSGAVVISTQSTSVRAANLLASFIIIPVALLIQVESVMMLWADYRVLWLAVAGLVVLVGLLVRMGISHLNREELLGRELDVLNLRWLWRVFRNQFIGSAHSVWSWYLHEIPQTIRRMRIPIAWMTLLLGAAIYIGSLEVKKLGISPEMFGLERLRTLDTSILSQFTQIGFFSPSNVLTISWHNVRAVSIAVILGMFTLGVAGALILMLPMVIIGFFSAATSLTGINFLTVLAAFTLPHGILEIPAMILAGAAILQVGASFVSLHRSESIGEGLMSSLADWTKITIGVVVPLFVGAAALEVFVSPQLMVRLLGGG